MPPQAAEGYLGKKKQSAKHTIWRFELQTATLLPGALLRIEMLAPAVIRWSADE